MEKYHFSKFVLFILALLISLEVNAAAFDSNISITGETFFDDGTDTGFSFGNTTGQMTNIEGGSSTATTLAGDTATGNNPLSGTLTDIGDSFSFGGSGSATTGEPDFAIGIDNQITIENTNISSFEVVLQLDYRNLVSSSGTDAFSNSEFSLSMDGGSTEHFFTHLVSDTVNENENNGAYTGNYGGELSIDNILTITLLLAANETVILDSFWTLEGGAFESGDQAQFDSEFTFSVMSVTDQSTPPVVVPTPGTLILVILGLISFSLSRQRISTFM